MTGVSQLQMNTFFTPMQQSKPPPAHPSAQRKRQREAGSSYEVMLQPRQMEAAWAAKSHPYVRMCVNEITKRLFSGAGIVALRGEETQNPSPVFNTYLQRDMAPFARDALDAILAFGIVPIAFRRAKTAGLGPDELAPYVPRFGMYSITTWADAGMQRFAFYWTSAALDAGVGHGYAPYGAGVSFTGPYGQRDDSVLIAHDFGYDPELNGQLTSNLHTIATHLHMSSELSQLAMTAERIASNPPMILPYNSKIDDRMQRDFGESFFVGDPDRCQDRADAIYERDAPRQAEFADQLRQWETMTGMDARTEFGNPANVLGPRNDRPAGSVRAPVGARDFSGAEMPWARMYRLGVTDEHVNHQLPQVRRDYTQVISQIMDVVCGVLNVPRGLLASETTVRAGVEAHAEAMHRTVNRYADMLGSLMTGVYDHIFGNSDMRDELRIRMERRRRSPYDLAPQLLTERDLFEAARKTRIRLVFDLPPSTTMESLNFMYDRGILSWSTYGTAMLRLNGFSREQFDTTTDPLTKREKRVLLLGKDADAPPKPLSSSSSSSSQPSHGATTAKKQISSASKQSKRTTNTNQSQAKKAKSKNSKKSDK